MSDPRLKLSSPRPAPTLGQRPIGRYLVDQGLLRPRDLLNALVMQKSWDAPLGRILVAEGLVREEDVLEAVAQQHGLYRVDLAETPPDPALFGLAAPETWLKLRAVPLMRIGQMLAVATARPDRLEDIATALPNAPQLLAVVASETEILNNIAAQGADHLGRRAETRVPDRYSSRTWQKLGRSGLLAATLVMVALLVVLFWAPQAAGLGLCLLALATLVPVTGLKLAAFVLQIFGRLHDAAPDEPTETPEEGRLPRISILVPLFHETEIASTLVARLQAVKYPRALLEVALVLEEKDTVTRAALQALDLPGWMRVVQVPDTGPLTTKPRALNYALDFCDGDIIGVWDAEDAPAPDQLHVIAKRFARAGPDVACLQGILDYYNPRSNWISRCFSIEYAGWWRILLPGVQRMRLVLPLGGTTLFFRRRILEALGGWDAHNVTEDADLGVRLAREGYRTELVQTVTEEEATCRGWPWIKQRSRWLKGFLVTWLVHLRDPRLLRQQLGWWRVLGVHILMAGTVLQFLLAPALWTLWALPLGLGHPMISSGMAWLPAVLITLCVMSDLGNMAIGAAGVARRGRRFLLPWVITLPVYYLLGVAAAYKAVFELLARPYFWDKTQHGQSVPDVSPDRPAFLRPDADGS